MEYRTLLPPRCSIACVPIKGHCSTVVKSTPQHPVSADPQLQQAALWRRRAGWILVLIGVLTLLSGWRATELGFNYDFESFFPEDQPETAFYLQFRDAFTTDNDFILVGIERKEGVFDGEFLQAVHALSETLDTLSGVTGVISPLSMTLPVRDPALGMIFQRPLLRWDQPEKFSVDSAGIWNREGFVGSAFSEDGRCLALTLTQTPMLSKQGCDDIALGTDAVLKDWTEQCRREGLDIEVHRAGRAHAQVHYVSVMEREVALFVGLGLLLLIAFLYLAFRTWWGIVIPLAVILLSGLGTLAFMELTGKEIDIMTIVLPTIIFVVGMSDVVHIITRYLDELRAGLPPFPALRKAFREVGMATFLTSLTTAIGFLTLLSSSIGPIREFGAYTAAGVFIAFGLAFTLLPSVLLRSKAPLKSTHDPEQTSPWSGPLNALFIVVVRRRKVILGVTLAASVASVFALAQIDVNNFLLEDLREDDPLRQEFQYFENAFAGVRPYELAVRFPQGQNVLAEPEVLATLDSIEHILEAELEAGALIGPGRIARQAHRLLNGDRPSQARIPEGKDLAQLLKQLERTNRKSAESTSAAAGWGDWVNVEAGLARIAARTADLGATEIARRNARFMEKSEALMAARFDSPPFELEPTGTANLIDLNNRFLASDMVLGLLIAFAVVALIVGILFRSIRMVLVSLVPNVLPLLFIAGYMGAAGIDLKVSTSIIFTIAFGIAVDDTLHFLAKYKLLLSQGVSPIWALRRTFISTGKAIIVTSIILCGGFATLMLSSFEGTFHIGLLVSLTLAFAVLVDLAVLPLLLLPRRA